MPDEFCGRLQCDGLPPNRVGVAAGRRTCHGLPVEVLQEREQSQADGDHDDRDHHPEHEPPEDDDACDDEDDGNPGALGVLD